MFPTMLRHMVNRTTIQQFFQPFHHTDKEGPIAHRHKDMFRDAV